jgi:hypothetical protein
VKNMPTKKELEAELKKLRAANTRLKNKASKTKKKARKPKRRGRKPKPKKRGRKPISASTLKARGERRDSKGKIRKIATRGRGRPAKKGVKRTPKGRISRATGAPRGRRPGSGKKAPKTRKYMIKGQMRQFRLTGNQGGHKSKKSALKAAPKLHRIEQYQGRFYVYTRGRV